MYTMHPPSFLTSRFNLCFGLWFQPRGAQDARESPDGAYSYVIDGPCPMSSLSNVSDLKHDNEEETCSSEGPERDILILPFTIAGFIDVLMTDHLPFIIAMWVH